MLFGIVFTTEGIMITLSHDINNVTQYLIEHRINSNCGSMFNELSDNIDDVQKQIDQAHYNYPRAKCVNLTDLPVVMPEPEPFIFNALVSQHVGLN